MHELAERLLKTIRKQDLLRAGDRVAVAVSGGADSVALLLLLIELRRELGIVLTVAHVNHKLRGAESDTDEQSVAKLAAEQGLELVTRTAPVERGRGSGIEDTARRLRYRFFEELARAGHATKIATAHTLDDQAETVLLRMFRGAGIRGLGGILPRLRLANEGRAWGEVVRPLLAFRRAELQEYLRARGQPWREDSSNDDVAFLRNRVRQRLIPVIAQEFGEAAIEHMAELAEIARAEEEWACSAQYFARASEAGLGEASPVARTKPGVMLDVEQLCALPLAAARRTVRAWIERNAPDASISFRLIEEILELAHGAAGKKLELPVREVHGGGRSTAADSTPLPRQIPPAGIPHAPIVRRGRKMLVLEMPASQAGNYEYELAVPGEVFLPELGLHIAAVAVDVTNVPQQDRQALLDPPQLGEKVVIRNWRPGDRYWPAHTKQEKKVKDLLSDRHATGFAKKRWPVAVGRGELVWMRGFAVPKAWQAHSAKAIWIREIKTDSSAKR
jgi:tRNA(Ile)-lysidine synthase